MPAIDNYFPFGDTVLCTTEKMARRSPGGIEIPESVRSKHLLTQGVILKVSMQMEDSPDNVVLVPGRIILFGLHTESIINLDNEEYAIVPLSGIIAYGPVLAENQDLVPKEK